MNFIYQSTKQWNFNPTIIRKSTPFQDYQLMNFQQNEHYRKFIRVVEFIYRMGIAEANQLYELYDLRKSERKYLVRQNILVAHQIQCKSHNVRNLYTLHENAKHLLPRFPKRMNNYWLQYDINDILQTLTAIEFYIAFAMGKKNIFLEGDYPPFSARIRMNDNELHLYVVRGGSFLPLEEFLRIAKLEKTEEHMRVIIICQRLNHLSTIIKQLEKSKVKLRIVDESKITEDGDLSNAFFYLEKGEICNERLKVQ